MHEDQNSISFSDFFERLLSATPLENQSQLAEKLQVGRASISLAKQKDSIPWKWIFTLANEFSLNSDWLATGKGSPYARAEAHNPDCVRVPHLLPQLSPDGSVQFDEHHVQPVYFRHEWLSHYGNPNEMASLLMTSPCLRPEIQENDLLLINLSQTHLLSGAIFALGVEELIMIRRIEKSPGHLHLNCENPAHRDLILSGDEINQVMILGKVVWIGRDYRC